MRPGPIGRSSARAESPFLPVSTEELTSHALRQRGCPPGCLAVAVAHLGGPSRYRRLISSPLANAPASAAEMSSCIFPYRDSIYIESVKLRLLLACTTPESVLLPECLSPRQYTYIPKGPPRSPGFVEPPSWHSCDLGNSSGWRIALLPRGSSPACL